MNIILFCLHSWRNAGWSVKVRIHRWLNQSSRSRASRRCSWWRAVQKLLSTLSKFSDIVQHRSATAASWSDAFHRTSVRSAAVAIIPGCPWNMFNSNLYIYIFFATIYKNKEEGISLFAKVSSQEVDSEAAKDLLLAGLPGADVVLAISRASAHLFRAIRHCSKRTSLPSFSARAIISVKCSGGRGGLAIKNCCDLLSLASRASCAHS